jgi:hypothetical protein
MQPVLLSDFKTPGADLQGVYYLRNERDAATLVDAIATAKAAGGQVVGHILACGLCDAYDNMS